MTKINLMWNYINKKTYLIFFIMKWYFFYGDTKSESPQAELNHEIGIGYVKTMKITEINAD